MICQTGSAQLDEKKWHQMTSKFNHKTLRPFFRFSVSAHCILNYFFKKLLWLQLNYFKWIAWQATVLRLLWIKHHYMLETDFLKGFKNRLGEPLICSQEESKSIVWCKLHAHHQQHPECFIFRTVTLFYSTEEMLACVWAVWCNNVVEFSSKRINAVMLGSHLRDELKANMTSRCVNNVATV